MLRVTKEDTKPIDPLLSCYGSSSKATWGAQHKKTLSKELEQGNVTQYSIKLKKSSGGRQAVDQGT